MDSFQPPNRRECFGWELNPDQHSPLWPMRWTSGLGIPKEERAFNAHLTLARGGGGSGSPRRQNGGRPSKNFQRLQEKLSALSASDFGTMTAHEFFLYQSQLSRGGSRYTKIARFALN